MMIQQFFSEPIDYSSHVISSNLTVYCRFIGNDTSQGHMTVNYGLLWHCLQLRSDTEPISQKHDTMSNRIHLPQSVSQNPPNISWYHLRQWVLVHTMFLFPPKRAVPYSTPSNALWWKTKLFRWPYWIKAPVRAQNHPSYFIMCGVLCGFVNVAILRVLDLIAQILGVSWVWFLILVRHTLTPLHLLYDPNPTVT